MFGANDTVLVPLARVEKATVVITATGKQLQISPLSLASTSSSMNANGFLVSRMNLSAFTHRLPVLKFILTNFALSEQTFYCIVNALCSVRLFVTLVCTPGALTLPISFVQAVMLLFTERDTSFNDKDDACHIKSLLPFDAQMQSQMMLR